MAIPSPASITVGDVIRGREVTISWSSVPDALGYVVERSLNGAAFGNIPQYDIFNTAGTYMTVTVGDDWNTVQYRVHAFKYEGAYLVYSDWTTSDVKTVQTAAPPTPSTGARLEQFQNSAGTDIYPRTIVEGIFRQSDGKTLTEILEEIKSGIWNTLDAAFNVDTSTGSLIMTVEEDYGGPQFRLVDGELEVVYG